MGVELAPVEGMLDEMHDPLPIQRDQNAYSFGSVGDHNVVIVTMPEIGNNAAATTITQLLNDFPAIRFGLLVGIGGGVPGDVDVRLGDVVVAQSTGTSPGVVQYDMGKKLEGGRFRRTGSLNKPPAILSANVRKLDGQHRRLGHNLSGYISEMVRRYPTMQNEYSFPTAGQDQLFLTTYEHRSGLSCDECDDQQVVSRQARPGNEPRIHYGTIGSANQVVKDAVLRDKIRADTDALCIEMEAAGLMGDFPCLVIRGICDYADSHKNKQWQPYAAAVAAAYMKALLLIIPHQEVSLTGYAAKNTASPFKVGVHLSEAPIIEDDLFIDRFAELQEMEKILQPRSSVQKHHRLVLGGIGGVGKTQLAIAYAKRHCDSYDSIFWLNAASETALKQSVRLMAQRLFDVEEYQGLDNDDQVLLRVTCWLLDGTNTQWLLVMDNYDEPDTYDIGRYCPYNAHGSAIITTRQPEQVRGQQLTIRPLNDIEQSLEILASRSKRKDVSTDPHAFNLAKRLQGLPLALATVGAYLKNSTWTFEEYLQIYEKQFNVDTYRSFQLPEYQNRTLYTTWDVTYARLEADHPTAAKLLRSFAFFDNQHLQYEIFRVINDHSSAHKLAKMKSKFRTLLRTQAAGDSLEWIPRMSINEFESAMHLLTECCFVEVRSTHNDFSVHSCVHDWALSSLNDGTRSNGYWFVFDRIADLVNSIDVDCCGHLKYSSITPHAVRLSHVSFDNVAQSASRRRLESTCDIALFLQEQERPVEAEQMLQRALAGKEKALGPVHVSTLNTVALLGVLYSRQGKFVEAKYMLQRALTGRKKTLGSNHVSTLSSLSELGFLFISQNKLAEAERIFQRVLVKRKTKLGPDHISTLTVLSDLGIVYVYQGKLVEAAQIFQRVLAVREEVLGSGHTMTHRSLYNLGNVYQRQGNLDEAEQIYERLLGERESLFGPEYTLTLKTASSLGSVLFDQGKLDEAEQMSKRALAGYEKRCLLHDPTALDTAYDLATIFERQEKLDEAKDMFQRVFVGRSKTLGPDHMNTQKAVQDLARISASTGD